MDATTEQLLKINGDAVTLGDLVEAWLQKQTRFTNAPWSSPASNLSAEDYAKVSLIDENEPGEDKVKAKIKLPIRSTPGGPVNRSALRAVAGALGGARGQEVQAGEEAKRKAARTVVRLMREAGMEPGDNLLQMAGMQKSEKSWDVEIFKAAEKQIVYGVVLRPGLPDSQGDTISADEIEKAAHNFMLKSRLADWQHEVTLSHTEAIPVESYIAPIAFEVNGYEIKKGDWVVGMKILSKSLWQKIKKGEARAFSIRGVGIRQPVTQ